MAVALLPLVLVHVPFWRRGLAVGAILASALVWSVAANAGALTNVGVLNGASPAEQLAGLINHPGGIPAIAAATMARYGSVYGAGFFGLPGWLDTPLPAFHYIAAASVLGLGAVAASIGLRGETAGIARCLILLAGLLISAACLFGVQYLTWTASGSLVVEGIPSRYFLPFALLAAGLLPALGSHYFAWLHRSLVMIVVAFPVVTLAVVMRVVVLHTFGKMKACERQKAT